MNKSHILCFLFGGLAVLGINAQAPHHVYELRTYTAPPGKLDALEARFRDHTEAIFKRHGLIAIGYWVPEDNKNNQFIYIVEHKSKEDATRNWAAFQADDEWKKVRAESEANGPLTTKAPDSVYMDPVDFSKLK
jgi:heme-degrading monooxygenase HmoA